MAETPNHGLIVSGSGTVNAGALAIGERARAVNKVIQNDVADHGRDDLARRLSELVRELEKHSGEIPDGAELLDATGNVAQELAKEKPSTFTVKALLAGIAAGAGSVTSVVTAVQAVKDAVQNLT
jgi:hypothetical protein